MVRPVVTAACHQPNALAFTLHDEPVAVVLYFVKPVGTEWDFGAARRDARLVLKLYEACGSDRQKPGTNTILRRG